MKMRLGHALFVAPLVGLLPIACSGGEATDEASMSAIGTGSLALLVKPGTTLNSVSYQITGPQSFTKSGTIDVGNSTKISANISPLPGGTGYQISLTGTSTDGATSCAGTASFDVVAHQTSNVTVHLDCHEAARTGSVMVNGVLNVCPVIDGIDANPADVFVGTSVALSADTHDADHGPSPL